MARLLETAVLSADERAVARTIQELAATGAIQSPADMQGLVAIIHERHGADAPVESVLAKALDRIDSDEERGGRR